MRRALLTAVLLFSLLVSPVAAAEPADLHVEQESYVSGDVSVDTRGDTMTYHVNGDRVFIQPKNFNQSDVVGVDTQEDEGTLKWNRDLGVYEFTADSDGTYHLHWNVAREETVGNETRTVTERYTAVMNVSSASVQTVQTSRLDKLQTAAANWEEWTSTVKAISGQDADIEMETQLAADLLDLRRNPVKALTGRFWQLGVVLFVSFAGLMWVLLFGLYNWLDKRQLRKELNEKKALLPDRGELEEKLAELDHKDDLQSMVTTRPTDWYDDPNIGQAAAEAHGDNLLSHFSAFEEMISGIGALKDRLRAMASAGYRARIQRDEAGDIVDTVILPPDGDETPVTDGGDVVALNDLPEAEFERVHETVDVKDPEIMEFSYSESDIDRSELREESEMPSDLDEMLDQMEAEIERYGGDKETYGEYLEAMLEDVIRHPNTDNDSVPRGQRWMQEQFYQIAVDARDIFGIPVDFQADVVRDILANHDPVEEARRVAEQDRHGEDPDGEAAAGGD